MNPFGIRNLCIFSVSERSLFESIVEMSLTRAVFQYYFARQ